MSCEIMIQTLDVMMWQLGLCKDGKCRQTNGLCWARSEIVQDLVASAERR